MKKTLLILLTLLLCLVSIGTAFAEGETAANMYYTNKYTVEDITDGVYDFIKSTKLEVDSTGSGIIDVSLTVKTYESMQKLGFTSLKVQYWSGTSWVTDEEVTNQFSYSTDTFNYTHTFTGLYSGYQYRVKVNIRAKRAQSEVQDLTITSDSIICH